MSAPVFGALPIGVKQKKVVRQKLVTRSDLAGAALGCLVQGYEFRFHFLTKAEISL